MSNVFDIQRFMDRMKWNQQELAEALGVHRSKVGGWCAGYRPPSYENICKFLEAGMTLNEAFGPELEAVILKNQPSIDISALTPEDCRKIVALALGSFQDNRKDKK